MWIIVRITAAMAREYWNERQAKWTRERSEASTYKNKPVAVWQSNGEPCQAIKQ